MASKLNARKAGPISPSTPSAADTSFPQSCNAQIPPPLTTSSSLLASAIKLPANHSISYAVFAPQSDLASNQTHIFLERARLSVVSQFKRPSLLDSILPYVYLSEQNCSFWVFSIGDADSKDSSGSPLHKLQTLAFENLTLNHTSHFSYNELYPCSLACSSRRESCPSCLIPLEDYRQSVSPNANVAYAGPANLSDLVSEPPSTRLLPRQPLRVPYSNFIDAVREFLVDEMCDLSKGGVVTGYGVRRLYHGFLIPPKTKCTDWSFEWESQSRPLTYCHVSPTLTTSHIIFNFRMQTTSFLSLSSSRPIQNGAPIVLLPHSTPAYYLATYRGPVSALTKQFEASLKGLGAGDWAGKSDLPDSNSSNNGYGQDCLKYTQYVIAWVSVQNKRGEDKGTTVIWPMRLCVALSSEPSTSEDGRPLYAHGRHALPYIPELPGPLQASPIPAPAFVNMSRYAPSDAASSLPAIVEASRLSTTPITPSTPIAMSSSIDDVSRRIPMHNGVVCSSDARKIYRALAVSQLPVVAYEDVAGHAHGYVDSVAKERERERERIKKEREAVVQSPKLSAMSGNGTNSVSVSADSLGDQAGRMDTSADSVDDVSNDIHTTFQNDLAKTEHTDITMDSVQADSISSTSPDIKTEHSLLSGSSNNLPSSMPFASFSNTESQWMDLDMNFSAADGANDERADMLNLDTFGVFTDDDFSFFDGPSKDVVVPPSPPLEHSLVSETTGLTPAAGPALLGLSPSIFNEGMNFIGQPTSGTTPIMSHPSPWMTQALADGFSPNNNAALNTGNDFVAVAENVMPRTPPYSQPASPSVQVVEDGSSSDSKDDPSSIFSPVAFAIRHRISDNKYNMGKFALPSPPDDEDRTLSLDALQNRSWKNRYNSITDPRFAIVKRLALRKNSVGERTDRGYIFSGEFVNWSSNGADMGEEREDQMDDISDDETIATGEEDIDMITRPSTPLPSYLPLGVPLLSTHFLHSLLLPLSTNLRPPNAAFEIDDIPLAAAISVPTPVSPAAVLGAITEKTKSLEAVAQLLCQEVVENAAWADAWKTSAVSSMSSENENGFLPLEAQLITNLILHSQILSGILPLEEFLASGLSYCKTGEPSAESDIELERLDTPKITIGKSGAIMQALPPVTRFWDKLGLSPRSGAKDVHVFVLFEENGHFGLDEMEGWLRRLSGIYKTSGYGTHVPGQCLSCPKSGLVPLRFDTFRKTLGAFMPNLSHIPDPILFYIVTPSSILSLTSSILRQVFSTIRRTWQFHSGRKIYFRFVPEYLVDIAHTNTLGRHASLRSLVGSVYDLLQRPVSRSTSLIMCTDDLRRDFEAPAFTLARSLPKKAKYLFQHSHPTLGVTDHHTFLHIGYSATPAKKWITAACTDEMGTMHQLRVWLTQDDFQYSQVVSQVWNFGMEIAQKANVEWRLVIAKLGIMDESELDAWASHLSLVVSTGNIGMAIHVSIVSVEEDNAWTFTQPSAEKSSCMSADSPGYDKGGHGVFLADSTSTTYMLPPKISVPMECTQVKDPFMEYPFIPEDDDAHTKDFFHMRSLQTSALIHVKSASSISNTWTTCIHYLHSAKSPQSTFSSSDRETHEDLTRNYHELSYIAQMRFGLKTEADLPFHLGALQVIQTALERGEVVSD